ncbi:NAD(P)-dependent alcohol dehydrogenase [Microbulbifer flavimaris]|uniref:NAD(P)-dependent alcohol dehydrogenase n=1 Tax=Microbulbifer flavimaris TaxID=1781068 RepID=A0ABX4I1B6_9GAMM|nr:MULTISPECIES: NAD(P)-dependent alcohol dehydrogenase [Microbulbifer]KUJ83939.1 alcohol dehydrogenase [Microbulbifer sp. ZGT114]PCO06116.1 NAD(P)-dependent alcohol dehydrogenase [Microbulbifer flavimaris]
MINAYAAKEAGGELSPYQYDPGKLQPREVEIEVMYCGLCHSDVSIIDDEWGMSDYPVVPGHEVVGRVGQVGEQVSHLQEGQLVGLGWHSAYCNHCHSCNSGNQNLCGEATFTIVGHHGGFADKVRAEAEAVIPIPDSIDPSKAGPLFCAGITVFNPLVQFDIKPNSQVGVIGIGGLGHLALQFLNAWGCEVTALTSSDSKRDEALELGAHHTINSRDEDAVGEAAGRFDVILSTVNAKLDWNLYLSTLKPQGRLHFVGATTDPLDINVFQLILGQRQVSGSPVGSPDTITQMLEFAARHKIEPQVEMFPMSKVNDAIAHLKKGDARYRVVLEAGK